MLRKKEDHIFYFNQGLELFNKKEPNRALTEFNKCLEINVMFAPAYFYKGKIFEMLGKAEEALMAYSLAYTYDDNKNLEYKTEYFRLYSEKNQKEAERIGREQTKAAEDYIKRFATCNQCQKQFAVEYEKCPYCDSADIALPLSTSTFQLPLSEDETIIKTLESGWHVVKHGEKFEWTKSTLRFELLRKPVLTNKRLILLKGNSIDWEIPLQEIQSVEIDTIGTGNPVMRMRQKNGVRSTLIFVVVHPKMALGFWYGYGKERTLTDSWVWAISNQSQIASSMSAQKEASQSPDPLTILKMRYATGEITKEQYEEMKKVLES